MTRIRCTGTQRERNGPVAFIIQIEDPSTQRGQAVQITIENAIELRRELADFLNANNVPTR